VIPALLLMSVVSQSTTQQSEADRKLLADVRGKAEKGDAQSQYELGQAFDGGSLGVAKNEAEAVKWYRRAAEQNDAGAQCALGVCYANGQGVAKDEAEAVKWFGKAAEQNDALAQYNLGIACHDGRGVAKHEAEAVKWFRKAAEQNYAKAQNNLGSCYYNGQGVAKDEAEAVKWFRKAAEQKCAGAQYNLGAAYYYGQGVAKDEAEAVRWYRRAAQQNYPGAQDSLGVCYVKGQGVANDEAEAVKWFRRAAEQNEARAQYNLGVCYYNGQGVGKDEAEAVKWIRKAAEQNYADAQYNLGACYHAGRGVVEDYVEAVKWFRKAAEQNLAIAQARLGLFCVLGEGVAKDYVEAYKWWLLAAGQGNEDAKKSITTLEDIMTREEITEGQKLARNFESREVPASGGDSLAASIMQTRPECSGTGFFITEEGYLITNEHVAGNGAQVRLVTEAGLLSARVVKVDAANDLALLKVEGEFTPLPVISTRAVKMGSTVATVGFPNIGLQGFAPKMAKGEIAALSGAQDDPRYFQISVPVQPGNSGGALVDERGNVVGVVSAKLNVAAALATSGALPENVNYAVKSSFLLSFLESVPEVAAKLKEPNAKDRKFEDVVKSAEQAAVLVLVY
jgi:uncharacterized protein